MRELCASGPHGSEPDPKVESRITSSLSEQRSKLKFTGLEEEFECPARVVHSGDTDMGVMFGYFTPGALFVLQKWIQEARYMQSVGAAE
jgi:hypothetical protein